MVLFVLLIVCLVALVEFPTRLAAAVLLLPLFLAPAALIVLWMVAFYNLHEYIMEPRERRWLPMQLKWSLPLCIVLLPLAWVLAVAGQWVYEVPLDQTPRYRHKRAWDKGFSSVLIHPLNEREQP